MDRAEQLSIRLKQMSIFKKSLTVTQYSGNRVSKRTRGCNGSSWNNLNNVKIVVLWRGPWCYFYWNDPAVWKDNVKWTKASKNPLMNFDLQLQWPVEVSPALIITGAHKDMFLWWWKGSEETWVEWVMSFLSLPVYDWVTSVLMLDVLWVQFIFRLVLCVNFQKLKLKTEGSLSTLKTSYLSLCIPEWLVSISPVHRQTVHF